VAVDSNGNAIAAGNLPGQGDITLTSLTTVPGPPRLVETCIAQSTFPSLAAEPLAAGELFSIYGAGFGPVKGVTAQPSGNTIGTQLGGVQVLIEDTPAPLLYVSSAQINLVAPYLLNGRTAAHIKIVTANTTSNEVVLGVRPAMPEIFENSAGDVALLNQDGEVNGPNNPAHIGDTVSMFVSGVGQITPAGVDGEIPQTPGGTPLLPIIVQVISAGPQPPNANVTYAGNAPGLVSGVTQVNFQIPQVNRVGAGPVYQAFVVLSVGGASTNLGPQLWFQ
jgi:trimeric autotransporter adhesin